MRRVAVGKAQGDVNMAPFGDHSDDILRNAGRAFGNFIEYAPICLLMLALMEIQGATATTLWWIGGAFVLGRILHAYGMLTNPFFPLPRILGMFATYAALLVPAVWFIKHIWLG